MEGEPVDVDGDVIDGVLTRALGEELRRVRHSVGWTRAELVSRMPSEIHSRTLATYEQGVRQCTVARLVEICHVLGVAAPDVLGLALQRAQVDLQAVSLQVDLRAVLRDQRPELIPLRRWAEKRLESEKESSGVVRLQRAAVQEIAILLGYSMSILTRYLAGFAPQRSPRLSGTEKAPAQ
jgi:transcriptional regulator with XRE-family HTH domain